MVFSFILVPVNNPKIITNTSPITVSVVIPVFNLAVYLALNIFTSEGMRITIKDNTVVDNCGK